MPSTSITEEKAALRRAVRARLSAMSPEERAESDGVLFHRFLALPGLAAADRVLLFCGMGTEPDTARLIPALLDWGKQVLLPRCLPGRGLEARLVRPDSALIPHPYGMLEPGEDCPLVGKDAIGLVLVPGLAFDPSGGRLGQGAGFYDRWLADYAGCTAALCRTALLLPQVPRAPHGRRRPFHVFRCPLWGRPVSSRSRSRCYSGCCRSRSRCRRPNHCYHSTFLIHLTCFIWLILCGGRQSGSRRVICFFVRS